MLCRLRCRLSASMRKLPAARAGGGFRDGRRSGRVRLCDRRRRHGRLRAGEPALGGPEPAGAAAGGRRARPAGLDPHSGRLSLHPRQAQHRLVLPDRAGARPQRPRAQLPARQGAGRLLGHQRHDLHARAGGRLRPLAPARQSGLVVGRRAALLPALGGPFRRARPVPRQRRRVAGGPAASVLGAARRLPGGRGRVRHPEDGRLQPRRQ